MHATSEGGTPHWVSLLFAEYKAAMALLGSAVRQLASCCATQAEIEEHNGAD